MFNFLRNRQAIFQSSCTILYSHHSVWEFQYLMSLPAQYGRSLSCSAACGIFPDQGSNPCPLHWQADSQPPRHKGSPVVLFNVSNSNRCVVLFHCGFNLHFPNNVGFRASFDVLNCHLYIFLLETYVPVFCSSVKMGCFVNEFWEFLKNIVQFQVLYQIYDLQIFYLSQWLVCLFFF